MKKICSIAVMLFTACLVFAAESFTVKSVKGKVTYEASAGKFKEVSKGQTLSLSTVINTGVNSMLTLTGDDGKDYTVKAMSKGSVEKLTSANVAGGFKKNPVAGNINSIAAAGSTGKGTGTASERASGKGEEAVEIDE